LAACTTVREASQRRRNWEPGWSLLGGPADSQTELVDRQTQELKLSIGALKN